MPNHQAQRDGFKTPKTIPWYWLGNSIPIVDDLQKNWIEKKQKKTLGVDVAATAQKGYR